jgi:hypothetical protein
MRVFLLTLASILAVLPAQAKPLIGAPKSIPLGANGVIGETVVKAEMGQGGYLKGVKKAAVPLIAVAFESSAKAAATKSSGGSTTRMSLESHLLIDEKVLQAIADELQAMVEKDLAAEGFEILPKDSVDQEARWTGIAKNDKPGVEVGDNFMSGFAGNGTKNRWYTAGNRPLFGTGSTGVLSELSPLIRTAREKKISLLFYRFKVQFADIDAKTGAFFAYVKGKNLLHMVSADLAVFSPEQTLAVMLKLKADITAGSDYVQEVQELPKDKADQVGLQMGAVLQTLISGSATTASSGKPSGHYAVIANPERYRTDSLLLLQGVSRQFAQALRKAQ